MATDDQWSGYINQQIVPHGFVDQAALTDLSGYYVYGKSSSSQFTPQDLITLANVLKDPAAAQQSGPTINGQKFFCTSTFDDKIQKIHLTNSKKEGIIIAKLTNYALTTHYSSSVPANNAMAFVDKAAQELVKSGL
jgi:hypothetical protein